VAAILARTILPDAHTMNRLPTAVVVDAVTIMTVEAAILARPLAAARRPLRVADRLREELMTTTIVVEGTRPPSSKDVDGPPSGPRSGRDRV